MDASKEGKDGEYEINNLDHSSNASNVLASSKFESFQLAPQEQEVFNASVFDLIGSSTFPIDVPSSSTSRLAAISIAYVFMFIPIHVSMSMSGLQLGPESEKIATLEGLDDPSVSFEGDITAAEIKEQEVQTE